MGRWIDWKVSEDLTYAEIDALTEIVSGPLREALPLVAKKISEERPVAPGVTARLAMYFKDRATAKYATNPETFVVTDEKVQVAGSDDQRSLNIHMVAGEYSGHTVGFQDYASIGVLAAASQVSGKVVMTGGDDLDTDYVESIVRRLNHAGAELGPKLNFTGDLSQEDADSPCDHAC